MCFGMPDTTKIEIDVLHLTRIAMFITTVEEITGTTNDPNTATNLRAALDKLYEGTKDV